MTIFLYFILFIIGTLIGSFCTLAVYRIPLKKDITHERSFCPNCNHKLAFLDLIPILSYVFLRGKCRYCGQKIRIRYLILEVLAGVAAVLFGLSFNFKFPIIELDKWIYFFFGILYITGLTIIAGIDKERKKIQMSVLVFCILVALTYIIYLFVVGQANINRYAIYLFCVFTLICTSMCDSKMKEKRKLPLGFYICIVNIVMMILQNFIYYYYYQ